MQKLVLLALLVGAGVQAENWPHWRGPKFNGSSPERNLPAQWSKTENLAWSVDLAGASAATPIISENHVFLSSTDTRAGALVALAIDRTRGQV